MLKSNIFGNGFDAGTRERTKDMHKVQVWVHTTQHISNVLMLPNVGLEMFYFMRKTISYIPCFTCLFTVQYKKQCTSICHLFV